MARFLSYNTSDPNSGQQALGASGGGNNVATIGPIMASGSSKIVGSVIADQNGTCVIQQSFDYLLSGGEINPNAHWDVVGYPTGTTNGVTAATVPNTIDIDVIAPAVQVVFTNTAASAQTYLRIFLRVYGPGR